MCGDSGRLLLSRPPSPSSERGLPGATQGETALALPLPVRKESWAGCPGAAHTGVSQREAWLTKRLSHRGYFGGRMAHFPSPQIHLSEKTKQSLAPAAQPAAAWSLFSESPQTYGRFLFVCFWPGPSTRRITICGNSLLYNKFSSMFLEHVINVQ